MQNNTCIIWLKLNAQKVFLSQKFTLRDICATHQLRHRWRFAWNDARHRSKAASVRRRHELVRPAAAFLTYFCSRSGSGLCSWVAKGLVKWTHVSLQKVDCPKRSVRRNIALLEDKELARSHPWQAVAFEPEASHWFSSLIFTLASIKIWSIPDHSPQLGHTHGHQFRLGESRACIYSRRCGTTCLFLVAASA